ncbi:MAG TPA: hypothetical protein VFD06_11415 [Candidatus Polarisedimenticolia bacterium]|nr:hypothetical protein [Candidatus Polarisedimenticolia bacterium]
MNPPVLSPPDAPLPHAAFAAYRQPAGPDSLRIDIQELSVRLDGLPSDLAAAMRGAYGPYVAGVESRPPLLRIDVMRDDRDYFIEPRFHKEWEVYRVLTEHDGAIFRLTSYRFAAWYDLKLGYGQLALAQGDLDPAPRAMENFLRSAFAWLSLDRGGFFLHGASIERDGRCHVFYGPSGAGKSTLSAMSRQGRVISDDLTPLLRTPQGLDALGSPFRGTYRVGEPVVGRFPVAAFYRLRKDARTFLRRGDGACFADLLGNLPWVVDQLPRHPHHADRVHEAVADVPFYYLHFEKDVDFWPAIDRGPDRALTD